MLEVSTRQLSYFDALARHLHFGRAADESAISQPALSMQIAELEAKLGVRLVERTRQGVLLTQDGQEFALRGRRILDEMRDLVDTMQKRDRLSRGPLRFGVIPSVAPYVLPRFLPGLRQAHPELELQLRETLTRPLVEELRAGQLDVLLLALPLAEKGVETLPLFHDRFLLAAPKAAPFAGPLYTVDELLKRETLLLLEEGHCLRDQALDFCKLRRDPRVDTFGVSTISTVVQMVANGHGVTLLPEIAVELETRNSDIRLLRFAEPQPGREIGLAWRAHSPLAPVYAEYGRLILESMSAAKPETNPSPA